MGPLSTYRTAQNAAAVLASVLALSCTDKLVGVNASIVVSPMQLAFPLTTVGSTQNIQVSITNQGSAALTINAIKVSSDPDGELAVANLLTADCNNAPRAATNTLSPGDCATFTATWSPASAHQAAGSVEVDSSDLQTPTVTLPVSGDAIVSSCTPDCGADQTCCGNTCVDTQNDPAHCGGCSACQTGQTCNLGVCTTPAANGCDDLTAPCGAPEKCCNHQCVDVSSSGGLCPCTGNGNTSSFGVGTIIIPMDTCWQRGQDITTTPSYCTSNAKTVGDDSPLKAYGLVFFLIRHQVTVYVVIDPNKSSIDAVDMALVSLDNQPPVKRYDWSSGQALPLADTTQNEVEYRGGPFLIDASQHDRVMQLLASDPDFAQFRSAGNITIHVANQGFQSVVAKSIDAVPSRIALLTPAGDNGGNNSTYQILVRYLDSAGLNFPGAGGTPASPGQIYDQLQESDFLPDFDHSNLKANGYKLLWSPHWEGGTSNTSAQLATIGAYVAAGGDLFAECAAIGTLEGFPSMHGGGGGGGGPQSGSTSTRFMTSSGMAGNSLTSSGRSSVLTGPFTYSGLSSPFAQRGDFPFNGFNGVITDFHPNSSNHSTYDPGVVRYVSETVSGQETDLFASIDQHTSQKGTVVYLAGHDYSYGGMGASDLGITAGSRLVLNTLFSLGTNNVCSP